MRALRFSRLRSYYLSNSPCLVTLRDPSPKFYGSLARANDLNIFPNDLQKTLDAHRSTNRASIIRKVFPKTPHEDVSHPLGSVEDSVRRKASNDLPSSVKSIQSDGQVNASNTEEHGPPKKAARRRSQQPHTSLLQLGPWSVDEAEGRPEQSPWIDHMDLAMRPSDPFLYLDAEIRALESYMLPTPREHLKVDELVASVTDQLKGILPHPPLVVGSRRTGFATSHSNLDLILPIDDVERSANGTRNHKTAHSKMRDIRLDILRNVANTLEQNPLFSCVHIPKRVPLVTAIHSPTGLQLQLYCGDGLPSSIEYISSYFSEYPTIRPLYMAVRVILEAQGMLGAHRSSIRSSALLMLLVAFLKMNHGRFQRTETLGEQLLAFLHTYGTSVDLTTTGVAVDPPGFFNADSLEDGDSDGEFPSAQLRGQQSLINIKNTAARRRNFPTARRLCIQDPSNYMIDIGRSCTRTAELQKTFADAYARLQTSLETWDASERNTPPSILSHVLRANFDDFEAKRIRLAFGSDQ